MCSARVRVPSASAQRWHCNERAVCGVGWLWEGNVFEPCDCAISFERLSECRHTSIGDLVGIKAGWRGAEEEEKRARR